MNKRTKIFYAVQVSNYTIEKGFPKWLLRNDACTNIMIGIVSTILERYPNDYEFLIKLPAAADTSDVKDLYDLFKKKYHEKIDFFRDEIPHSPVTSRFHFDLIRLQKCKSILENVDVMINDENTLTKNWNVLFNSLGLRIPIISTNYFLDSPIAGKVDQKIRYYERQMESFINSDIAAFQCEAGRIEAMEAYDSLYKTKKILAPQSVWGVGAHYAEISEYHSENKFDTPVIYFGNRISDTANRYTNYDSFAEAMGILSKLTNKPFKAIMLNPTRKATDEQLDLIKTLSNGVVDVISNDEQFTRQDYLEFINHAHIACNLFVTEVHGGVTHCEAMMAKNMVVMPKVNNYLHKMIKANREDYELFVDIDKNNSHKPDAHDIALKCKYALECIGTPEEEYLRNTCHDIGYEFESYERACDRIVNDIESLLIQEPVLENQK